MLDSAEVPVGLASLDTRAFKTTLQELFGLAALEENWDSYGGRPVSPRAVSAAVAIAGLVSYLAPDAEPLAVAPLASGGVQLTWTNGRGGEIEVDVSPDGTLGYLLVEGSGDSTRYTEQDTVAPDVLFGVLKSFLQRS
jgi:hypothetical protein